MARRSMVPLMCRLMMVMLLVACRGEPSVELQAPPVPHPSRQYEGVTITYYGDAAEPGPQLERALTERFTADTGIQVNLIPKPVSNTETYSAYQHLFRTQRDDVDVLMIDIIWTRVFAPHLVDLSPTLGEAVQDHFPEMIRNNTVGGRLIGVPYYSNVGLLYYRTDLLQKYGFADPPATWEELERMARAIQEGERIGNPAFAGFVWQGKSGEALTCNGLEWQASHGGGHIINPETGAVEVNNPRAIAAFKRAAGWIGTISPVNTLSYDGDENSRDFNNGNAAFMRNWAYVYAITNPEDSPMKGKFDVAPLPHAEGPYRSASTRGEWQLGVSAYSKHPAAAIEFVRYMTSPEVQQWRAMKGAFPPTIPALYRNPEVLAAQPYLRTVGEVLKNHAVARPSHRTGKRYTEVSRIYFEGVAEILRGEDAAHSVAQIERDIETLLK